LESSIRKVMQLPPATRLLGGHGPTTTLETEQARNPFVREALRAAP
jgi:glyoxylase-like metal-dependent hydrolase (beta-lactamase superfamily II)